MSPIDSEYILLVERAVKFKGMAPIPRDYIIKALERIEKGEEKTKNYSSGSPMVKDVIEIAVKLFKNDTRAA